MNSKSLWQEWYFHCAFWAPMAIAGVLATMLWVTEYGFNTACVSAACFKGFLEAFDLPLKIWATAIPLSALAATTHRSLQAKRQIDLQSEQNTFSNYYKHLEEFEKHAYEPFPAEASKEQFRKLINVRYLHRLIYEHAQNGDLDPCDKFQSACKRLAEKSRLVLGKFRDVPIDMAAGDSARLAQELSDLDPRLLPDLDELIQTVKTLAGAGERLVDLRVGAAIKQARKQSKNFHRIIEGDTKPSARECHQYLFVFINNLDEIAQIIGGLDALLYSQLKSIAQIPNYA